MESFFRHQKMYHDTGEKEPLVMEVSFSEGFEREEKSPCILSQLSSWNLLSCFRVGSVTDSDGTQLVVFALLTPYAQQSWRLLSTPFAHGSRMKAETSVLFTLGSKLDGSERLNTYAQGNATRQLVSQ